MWKARLRKYSSLLLAVLVSGCSAAASNVDATKISPPVQQDSSSTQALVDTEESQVQKFRKLGQFYRKVYLSELVYDAMVDTEKLKRSIKIRQRLLKDGSISECRRTLRLKPIRDAHYQEAVLRFEAGEYSCKINDLDKFYHALLQDDFLSYFKLKKKTGSYWLYMDLTPLATWERYFWYAYFVEKGFEPEFSDRLRLFVLGHFSSAQDAIQLKNMYPKANLKVKFVVYQDTLDAETRDATPITYTDNDNFVLERLLR